MNIISDIKELTNLPLLNIAGKMTTQLILILLKSFSDPTLYLNLTSLKHSKFTKIIIMLLTVVSPSFLYLVVEKLTLNPLSSDSSFGLRFSVSVFFPSVFK